MILVDLVSIILRLAELAFAAIVAGLTGDFLHQMRHSSARHLGRFIYTEVLAGLSIVLAIIWLFPFVGTFIHWPVDVVIAAAWFASFGLLVHWLHGSCGYAFDWSDMYADSSDSCDEWKANMAFAFLSAVCWLASAAVGIYWVHRHTGYRAGRAPGSTRTYRRRWYRTRV